MEFRVICRDFERETPHEFESRLQKALNDFYSDISDNDVWDYVRMLGTGTDTIPGSETYICHKDKKRNKNIGF